jgi:transmembrane sensor
MQEERLKYLFDRYFQKQATPEELEQFFAMTQLYENEKVVQELMEEYWDSFVTVSKPFSEKDRDLMLNEILHTPKQANKEMGHMRLWPRIAAVAAAIAVVIFAAGIFYYNLNINKEQSNLTSYKNDIAPGKNGATLTLANGKKISLSDVPSGVLANESGISIRKAADGQVSYEVAAQQSNDDHRSTKQSYNTLNTSAGETYMLTLPDKSRVWMNASSSLTYAISLNERGLRRVKLEGEAYFEITKDKHHPFIVETKNQKVEVLGTHFNINSYANEPTVKTTLLEGSVRVSPSRMGTVNRSVSLNGGKEESIILKPGQQSTLTANSPITIKEVNTEDVIAWKNGLFVFDGDRLENIMAQLSRWYNIDVQYTDRSVLNETYSGTVTRFANISIVLRRLEITGNVKFKIDGRRIVVDR